MTKICYVTLQLVHLSVVQASGSWPTKKKKLQTYLRLNVTYPPKGSNMCDVIYECPITCLWRLFHISLPRRRPEPFRSAKQKNGSFGCNPITLKVRNPSNWSCWSMIRAICCELTLTHYIPKEGMAILTGKAFFPGAHLGNGKSSVSYDLCIP